MKWCDYFRDHILSAKYTRNDVARGYIYIIPAVSSSSKKYKKLILNIYIIWLKIHFNPLFIFSPTVKKNKKKNNQHSFICFEKLLISHHTRAFSHHLQTARAKVIWLTPGSISFPSPTRSFKDKLWLCAALCSKKRRDGSLRALTVSEMSASVTEGGLRWIRYGFINEHQAGTAVAISYRVVSICKAGRTREKWGKEKGGVGGMERLRVRRGETRLGDWKTGADGGEVSFSGSQTRYCFAKGATARAWMSTRAE